MKKGIRVKNINYNFFEEFKRLDKLCGDLYKDQAGITHYINDMKSTPISNYRNIPNWETDLKELVRLRHIRNNLAHTENAFDEDVCTQRDIDWIKDFYQRILDRSDPIAMLYQNSKKENKQIQQAVKKTMDKVPEYNKYSSSPKPKLGTLLLIAILIALLIFLGIILVIIGGRIIMHL